MKPDATVRETSKSSNNIRFIKSVISVGLIRIVALPLTLGTAVLLARLLGPESYGIYSFAISLATLLALPVGNGLSQLITRDTARAQAAGNLNFLNGVRLRSMHLLLGYTIFLTAVIILPSIIWGVGSLPIFAAAFLAPVLALYDINGGILKGLGKAAHSQVPLILIRPIAVLLTSGILLVLGKMRLDWMLSGHVLASMLVLLLFIISLHSALPYGTFRAVPNYPDAEWKASYIPFVTISGISLLNIEIGILMLGLTDNPEGVSGMRVAQSASQLVTLPLMVINIITQPKLAVNSGRGKSLTPELMQTYAQASRIAFAASLVIGTPIFFFAEFLVNLTFGGEYVQLSIDAIRILVLAQIFNAAVGTTGTLLAMSGNEFRAMRAQFVALILASGLAVILVPQFNATGAAFAISAGLIVKNALEVWYIRKIYGKWMTAFMREK